MSECHHPYLRVTNKGNHKSLSEVGIEVRCDDCGERRRRVEISLDGNPAVTRWVILGAGDE